MCFIGILQQHYHSPTFSECDGQIDLAFVLDSSGSIHRERFLNVVRRFVINITAQLDVHPDRVRVGK